MHIGLSLSELAIVAGLPPKIEPKNIVDKCGSFLIIIEGMVHLYHQSAKDYLMENFESRLQSAGIDRGHIDISMRCIDAMSSVLFRNMYSLHSGLKPKDTSPPEPDPLARIRNPCVFWADHICAPDIDCPELRLELADDGRVYKFLRERFLCWLESISLLGKFWVGIESIRRLLYKVQVRISSIVQGRRSVRY